MTDDICTVCGEPFPEDYRKYDPKAPVYADNYAYHLGCESEVFESVNTERNV